MPSPENRAFLLSSRQVEWLAEIAASIVRNNLTLKVPGNWRQIPPWWISPSGAAATSAAEPELLEDAEMAVSCLEAIGADPSNCPPAADHTD